LIIANFVSKSDSNKKVAFDPLIFEIAIALDEIEDQRDMF